jgi:thiamine pyrophosphokinase
MKSRVLAVLAGDRVSRPWLDRWLQEADFIFAADAGADLVLRAGRRPDLLVGDFDSVSPEGLASAKEVLKAEDQDFSDCEKLLGAALDRGIEDLVLCGLEGTRIDHGLHAVHSVARWPGRCLLAYETMLGRILAGPETLTISCNGVVSALPITDCRGVTMEGVRWPLDKAVMSPERFSSISNASEGTATISVLEGSLFTLWAYDGSPVWTN